MFSTDGSASWTEVVKRTRPDLKHVKVVHKKSQFVRKKELNSKVFYAGTQTIDRFWGSLDKYVPSTCKAKVDHMINPVLWQYVYSFMWRHNLLGQPLRAELANLCK